MNYVFLDEVQMVPEYQKAVDSLFVMENVDVYITGSNAYMLSGELATLLSGRYVEIQMLPLSFAEYWELVVGDKRDAWKQYFVNGGLPYNDSIHYTTFSIHLSRYIKQTLSTKSGGCNRNGIEFSQAFPKSLYGSGKPFIRRDFPKTS